MTSNDLWLTFYLAPRPAPRSSTQRERPKSVNPDRMLQMTGQSRKAMKKQLSLEVLEQLSLTREEWIEYFKTKKTPERLRGEIERLSPTVSEHVTNERTCSPNANTEHFQLSQPDTSQAESLNSQIRPKPRSRSLLRFESTNQSSPIIASRDSPKSDPQPSQADIIRQILAEIESAKFNLAKFLPDVSSKKTTSSHLESFSTNQNAL